MPNHCSTRFCFTGTAADISRLYQHLVVTEPIDHPDDDNNATENNQTIDFNRVIPMPPSLNIECGSCGQNAEELLQLKPAGLIKDSSIAGQFKELQKRLPSYGLNWDTLTVKQLIQLFDDNPAISQELIMDMALGRQYIANVKAFGYPNWYNWRVAHWGTKWNAYAYHGSLNEEGTEFSGCFNTAWSPAEPVFRALAQSYPDASILIRYIDEGSLFAGTYESDGEGQLIDYACNSDEEIRHFATEHFGWTYDNEEQKESSQGNSPSEPITTEVTALSTT